MKRRFNKGRFLIFIPFAILALLGFGALVMVLWNNILTPVLHITALTFWQALGILVLSKILFGGFRGGHWGHRHWNRGMMQRWEGMTPEEREKFKQEWKSRCGHRFQDQRFTEEKPQA